MGTQHFLWRVVLETGIFESWNSVLQWLLVSNGGHLQTVEQYSFHFIRHHE